MYRVNNYSSKQIYILEKIIIITRLELDRKNAITIIGNAHVLENCLPSNWDL